MAEIIQNPQASVSLERRNSIWIALGMGAASIFIVNIVFGGVLVKKISEHALSQTNLMSMLLTSLVLIVFMDLYTYLWHRLNHKIPLLWRFHEIHHLDSDLNSFSAIRFHFGEIMLSGLLRLAIFSFLPISFSSYLVFESVYAFANLFAHSRINIPYKAERIIVKLIVTPRFHRLHHHPERSIHDNNFSTIFSFWDRIFNTHVPISEKDSFEFGVRDTNEGDLGTLLIRPFTKTK